VKKVIIFTDGSCTLSQNGKGGYGALLIYGKHIKEIYDGYIKTTNNRAELMAVIFSLKILKESCDVEIYSDSKYVVDPINEKWLVKWIAKDFKGIKNADLWKELVKELGKHRVEFNWCKGHSGIAGNERADVLAGIGANLPFKKVDCRSSKLFDGL
jgi:ribonuclease HI